MGATSTAKRRRREARLSHGRKPEKFGMRPQLALGAGKKKKSR